MAAVRPFLPPPLRERVEAANESRKYLAHVFWWERVRSLMDAAGREGDIVYALRRIPPPAPPPKPEPTLEELLRAYTIADARGVATGVFTLEERNARQAAASALIARLDREGEGR